VKAPRGKYDFIQGLQPHFAAGEVVFVREFPELRDQLLSFPRGHIDAPNALAYALLSHRQPVYDGFRDEHVALDLPPAAMRPLMLAANAGDGWVTAALLQVVNGQILVLADWAYQGTAEEHIGNIRIDAAMTADATEAYYPSPARGWDALKNINLNPQPVTRRAVPKWVIPPTHFDRWMNIGLEQAIRHLPDRAQMGGDEAAGRELLKEALAKMAYGTPAVQITESARWTLRALAGGYCRGKNVEPEPGPYRTLMGGIEAALGVARLTVSDEDDDARQNFSFDRHGRPYKSILPQRERRLH
jgi:hypothetical protein